MNSVDYTAQAVHIRDLPRQISVFDGSGTEQARTVFEYDNYTPDAGHAALVPRALLNSYPDLFDPTVPTSETGTATAGTSVC